MISLIYGAQTPLIDKKVEQLVKEFLPVINDFTLVHFDCDQTPIQDIVEDALTMPFSEEKKFVIAKNAYFLSNKLTKEKLDQDFSSLNEFIQANIQNVILLFTLNEEKLDNKNEWVKKIKSKGQMIEVANIEKKDWPQVVRKLFQKRGVTLDSDALECFMQRTSRDLVSVIQEVDKLALYGNYINKEDIEHLIPRPLEDNVFGIAEAIISGDTATSIKIFRDLRLNNEEPVRLLPIIANQLRFFYQVGYLYQLGRSEGEIVKELGAHPYRITLALRRTGKLSLNRVLLLLSKLGDLDYEIKSGQVDRIQAFELFLVSITSSRES